MRVVSLFSGAGGLDLGLSQAGLELVWANDVFTDAVRTYEKNIGPHVDVRDINIIPSSDIPDCDVVVGGFPCQGFSVANRGRSTEDPRNQLYKQMVRVISEKRPRYFVGENVKGLASFSKGEVLKEILQDFRDLDYQVRYAVVNAADYGVPQARKRLIILGVRSDLSSDFTFPPIQSHCEPEMSLAKGLKPWFSVGKALSHLPEPEDATHIPNHEYSKYKLRFNGHIGHRFIDASKPAPTVTARGDERGGVVVLHHPRNHRRMSARELAAVQSFPDTFEFYGTKTSAYRQIANAVPPLLGRAIGTMLKKAEMVQITQDKLNVA